MHNLRFIVRLMQQIETALQQGAFASFKNDFLSQYQVTDEEVRLAQKQKWLNSLRYRNDTIS